MSILNNAKFKFSLNKNTKLFLIVSVFAVLAVFSIFSSPKIKVQASSTDNVLGYAWSSNIGWISLNGSNYGVNIDSSGNMTGYAWSSNIGWIKFGGLSGFPAGGGDAHLSGNTLTGWARACSGQNNQNTPPPNQTVANNTCTGSSRTDGWDGWISLSGASPAYGVTVDTTSGNFFGYGWGSDVVGWVDFSLVKYNPTLDMCLNITGIQTSVPVGMIADSSGNCVTGSGDMCPNISGIQNTIPNGMIIDSSGNCVSSSGDMCPNITGVQGSIPTGMITDSFGNCIAPNDMCPNIIGIQTTIPQDMVIDPTTGYCFTSIQTDLCPNDPGIQTTLPCANGDFCPDQPGIQTTLPCLSIIHIYPSCHFDGVKNYTETGIDCGGPDCPNCKKPPKFIEG